MLTLFAAGLACGGVAAADDPAAELARNGETRFEGAIGLDLSYGPEFQGARKRQFGYRPVVYLRYGRLSISSASGFVNKRGGDIVRGLGLEMLRRDNLRVSLGLRYDGGRNEDSSSLLAGLGDVPATLRVRASVVWRPGGPWRLGAGWSVDAFGRGGGNYGQLDASWERRLSPSTVLTLATGLSLAGETYMQTYYGISEAQSERSGYPVHAAGGGLRDVSASAGLRHEFDADWTLAGGIGIARLLGPAAASPLTRAPFGWSINTAFARRF